MSRWSDLRPLALATHEYWILTRTPLGDPTALDGQECPLHALQQITDRVGVGVG